MHIAGIVVQTRPEQIDAVRASLAVVPGLEVHGTHPDGRLVVTIEAEGRDSVADALITVHSTPQVLSACMVYEQSDTEPASLETTP